MFQNKKSNKQSSDKRKSPSASPGKKRLGDASLDWIKNTIESKAILPEQAEIQQSKTAGISKETKIGVAKTYISEKAEKKENDTTEVPPGFSAVFSTITKGGKVTPVEKKGAEKAEVSEKKETPAAQEAPLASTEPVKATEEKERITAEEVKNNLRGIKGTVPEEKTIPTQYEIAEKEITEKVGGKIEESAVHIPDDTSTIVKKKTEAASQQEIITSKDKTPSEMKETVAPPAAKEEMPPPSVKRERVKISGLRESLKKGSQKVSGAIAKPLKSADKTKFKESIGAAINVSKQPVKAISAVDRKITRSMKRVILLIDPEFVRNSLLKNLKSTDTQITKTAKKLIDSILD